jgi:hypothetical protein
MITDTTLLGTEIQRVRLIFDYISQIVCRVYKTSFKASLPGRK